MKSNISFKDYNVLFWNIICVIFCPASMSLTKWVSGLAINCNLGKKFFKLTRYFDDLNWMKLNSIVHVLLLLMLINGLWLSALRSTNLIIICNANLKAPKCLMKISLAVMKCEYQRSEVKVVFLHSWFSLYITPWGKIAAFVTKERQKK